MSFSDTYTEEVLQSRRTRSQRAGFWAKVVSFLLMLTVGAALAHAPGLRLALMQAGIEAVGKVASLQKDPPNTQVSQGSPALPDLSAVRAIMQQAQSETAIQSVQPDQPAKPRIRINRPGITENAGPQFQKVLTRSSQNKQPVPDETLSIDPQEVATKIDQLLRNIGMGGK